MPESTPQYPPLPPDDLNRTLTTARPDTDQSLPHIGLVGDTYTITVSGEDTAGRFCVIDMHIPPGADLHRTGTTLKRPSSCSTAKWKLRSVGRSPWCAPATPSTFPRTRRISSTTHRPSPFVCCCICSPSGQENFFKEVGVPVATRTTAPPKLDKDQQQQFMEKAKSLAPKYRTELLKEA